MSIRRRGYSWQLTVRLLPNNKAEAAGRYQSSPAMTIGVFAQQEQKVPVSEVRLPISPGPREFV